MAGQNRDAARRFKAEAKQEADEPPKSATRELRKVCLLAARGIILKTPVDTGRARGNWQSTLGAPATGESNFTVAISGKGRGKGTGGKTRAGMQRLAEASQVVAGIKLGDRYFLSNNLPYIEALEHGHSKQAAAGMVGVTIAELNALGTKP